MQFTKITVTRESFLGGQKAFANKHLFRYISAP